jgi:hypothetical protein
MKGVEFLDQLSYYHFLRKESVLCDSVGVCLCAGNYKFLRPTLSFLLLLFVIT